MSENVETNAESQSRTHGKRTLSIDNITVRPPTATDYLVWVEGRVRSSWITYDSGEASKTTHPKRTVVYDLLEGDEARALAAALVAAADVADANWSEVEAAKEAHLAALEADARKNNRA
jgi:hypothetical protein